MDKSQRLLLTISVYLFVITQMKYVLVSIKYVSVCPLVLRMKAQGGRTRGEIVGLDNRMIRWVGALQFQPANTGASHWTDMNLQVK